MMNGFAEIFAPSFQVGARVFDVSIEGVSVLDNYDIFAEIGALTATEKVFDTTVIDGALNINFDRINGHALISAIEVVSR